MSATDMTRLRLLRVSQDAILPTRAHPGDAGLDLYSIDDLLIGPSEGKVAKTGIAIGLPPGFVALVADRSSLARRGIKTAGGVIDAGYRGEIHIILWNVSAHEIQLRRGERIAQLLIFPICTPLPQEVSSLEETARGNKGFGSSGK